MRPRLSLALVLGLALAALGAEGAAPVGVVSHIQVLSDKVRDVSSLEAWKKSFLGGSMTDQEKALAVWRSVVMYRYQDTPPSEFRHEGCVHDVLKTFHVYGYGMCCCASANIEQLARHAGLETRGQAIHAHSVPEVCYDKAWHMLDASLVNYFPKTDGSIASVAEICAAVQGWLKEHPQLNRNDAGLRQFHQADGWMGWKRGPELIVKSPFFDWSGWWPAKTHGWYATMQEYDGSAKTPFVYEYGYSQGYELNIQLRPGERLTRNWFHRGEHVNGVLGDGGKPGCLAEQPGKGSMAYLSGYGDTNPGRVGSGLLEYDVPLAGGGFRLGALVAENLVTRSERLRSGGRDAGASGGPAVAVKDPLRPGVIELAMPSSYVYLGGEAAMDVVAPGGTKVDVAFSDNNGLDWRPIATLGRSGLHQIDLGKYVLRRYDYRLRLTLQGKGVGLEKLRIANRIQCSQRPLPTLGQGNNAIRFSAGPDEAAVTIEGTSYGNTQGKNVELLDFHPQLEGISRQHFRYQSDPAQVTFAVATPGDMARLRFGGHYRARDARDRWDVLVSFDGKNFRRVDQFQGPTQGKCQYLTVSDVPPNTRSAWIRWKGQQRNTLCLFSARIDADYRQPYGGFRPVKITYVWNEDGREQRNVHIARQPQEAYTIRCASRPEMKSVVLELAE